MTTKDNVALLLSSLEGAIRQDRRFFVAAQADPTFSPMEADVEGLLSRLLNEAKGHAERELAATQSAFAELKAWHGETGATNEAMSKLETRFSTKSYFGYLDALPLAAEARTKAEAALRSQKTSLLKTLDDLKARADSLQFYVTSRLPTYASRPDAQLAVFNEAKQKYDQAIGLAQRDHYASWMQALQLLTACIDVLTPLETNLANREREIQAEQRKIQAEARYQERVAEAKAERKHMLVSLHAAVAFLLLYVSTSAGPLAYAKWVGEYHSENLSEGILWMALLLPALSPVFVVLADCFWSIGNNEPGKEVQGGWLGLGLVTALNALIAPILTIVVYVRGMKRINSEFKSAMDSAERHRTG